VKDSDFAESETDNADSVRDLIPLLKKHHGDKLDEDVSLDDSNFDAIKDHLDSEREKRAARSKEEK